MNRFRLNLPRYKSVRLIALLALLFASGLALTNGRMVFGGAPAVVGPQPQNGDLAIAQGLRSALQNGQLSAAERLALQAKLAFVERASARPTPQAQANLPAVTLPTVAVPAGAQNDLALAATQDQISEGSEGLIHAAEAAVQNTWQGQRGGVDYTIIAGSAADDPAQGWIKVFAGHPSRQQVYLTPTQTGALRILAVIGTRITFTTPTGGRVYFDLATRAFN